MYLCMYVCMYVCMIEFWVDRSLGVCMAARKPHTYTTFTYIIYYYFFFFNYVCMWVQTAVASKAASPSVRPYHTLFCTLPYILPYPIFDNPILTRTVVVDTISMLKIYIIYFCISNCKYYNAVVRCMYSRYVYVCTYEYSLSYKIFQLVFFLLFY